MKLCSQCKWQYVKELKHNKIEIYCQYAKLHPKKVLLDKYGFNPKWGRAVRISKIKHCNNRFEPR